MNANRVILAISIVLVLSIGLLAACCAETPPPESPVEPSASADGETLLRERCAACHDLGRVTGASKDRAGWEQTVDRMVSKGARLSGEERMVLIDYLAKTYGSE
jgi:mono/diheme cytochrome c family protein